jgi:hypothetical protein
MKGIGKARQFKENYMQDIGLARQGIEKSR